MFGGVLPIHFYPRLWRWLFMIQRDLWRHIVTLHHLFLRWWTLHYLYIPAGGLVISSSPNVLRQCSNSIQFRILNWIFRHRPASPITLASNFATPFGLRSVPVPRLLLVINNSPYILLSRFIPRKRFIDPRQDISSGYITPPYGIP